MSESPVLTHQACPRPECGSSDGAIVFADGGTYCYVCQKGTKGARSPEESPSATPAPVDAPIPSALLKVDVQGIAKRNIPDATAEKWRYGYSRYGDRKCQVATYCDMQGRPVAQKLRFGNPKEFMIVGDASQMGLFGAHLWRDGGRSLVVTEGELDALSVSAAWADKWPVVSIPNGVASAAKVFQKNLEYLERFEKVVIMFDQDDPGREAAVAAAAVLSPGKAFIANLPGKDANELLMAGRADEIVKAYWDAKPWRPDGIVAFTDAWQRVLGRPHVPSIPIPHVGLQGMLLGLREGEITTIVAGTGAGKSTFMRELAAAVAQTGTKIGYIGLEEGVERSALGLVSVLVNRPLHLEEAPDYHTPEVVAATNLLDQNVLFYDAFGSLDPENLIARMRFMVKGLGAKVIFLDHLTIVTSGGEVSDDERRVLDWMMTHLAKFTQETKAHVVTIAHLSRTKGTAHEEGGRITLKEIRGTHGIGQLSHNVIAIERDQQAVGDADIADVRVLKNRWVGRTGLAGQLKYDHKTGRQLEHVGDSPFDDTVASDDV